MNDWQWAAYQYMQDNIENNRDAVTGRINATKLAKYCEWHSRIKGWTPWGLDEIAFAVVEMDAGRMTKAEARKWIEDYGGE